MTVDATAYNQWVYVNLKDGKTQTVTMEGSDDESAVTIDWQICHTSLYGSKKPMEERNMSVISMKQLFRSRCSLWTSDKKMEP